MGICIFVPLQRDYIPVKYFTFASCGSERESEQASKTKDKTKTNNPFLFTSLHFEWNNPSFRLFFQSFYNGTQSYINRCSSTYFLFSFSLCDFFSPILKMLVQHVWSICRRVCLIVFECYSGLVNCVCLPENRFAFCGGSWFLYLCLLDFDFVCSGKCFKLKVYVCGCVLVREFGNGIYVMNPFLFLIQRKLRIPAKSFYYSSDPTTHI